MADRGGKVPEKQDGNGAEAAAAPGSRSRQIASRGIRTSGDAKEFLTGLLADLADEAVSEKRANAHCNVMSKLLRVVDMEHKYGKPESQDKQLILDSAADPAEVRRRVLLEAQQRIKEELDGIS